ncbi:MAG TPA: Imm70 family immunity protein [Candidatus Angelobacter sp.]
MSTTYSLDQIAPDHVLRALFATISYRLEPHGWATRFPAVLDHLQQGSLDPNRAEQAITELGQIEAELRSLPPDRVVWSMDDLRVRNDSRQPVNHKAKNVFDYFVARDGTPLINKLREIVIECRRQGRTVKVDSQVRRKTRWKERLTYAGLFVGGIAMIADEWHQLITEHSYHPKLAMGGPILVLGGLLGCFIPIQERRYRVIAWTAIAIGLAFGGLNLYLMEHYFE